MIEIGEMTREERDALLRRAPYGHLGCARDGHPYVVPMHYAYDSELLYFFTTEGTKTEFMAANSEVCFQIEEVADGAHWQSVMIVGHARKLTKLEDMERALRLVSEKNPALTPALSVTKIGAWTRRSNIAIYRVHPEAIYGRKTLG